MLQLHGRLLAHIHHVQGRGFVPLGQGHRLRGSLQSAAQGSGQIQRREIGKIVAGRSPDKSGESVVNPVRVAVHEDEDDLRLSFLPPHDALPVHRPQRHLQRPLGFLRPEFGFGFGFILGLDFGHLSHRRPIAQERLLRPDLQRGSRGGPAGVRRPPIPRQCIQKSSL